MLLPASRRLKSFATTHMILPMVNKVSEKRRRDCLPNWAEMDAMTGWKTALVRRYEVPAQNASVDVPFKAVASDFVGQFEVICNVSGHTGRTATRIVASRATINEMVARLIMMNHSLFEAFQSWCGNLVPFASMSSPADN
jgi:hypothetical protein